MAYATPPTDTGLLRFAYRSRTTVKPGTDAFLKIVEVTVRNNRDMKISGQLRYHDGWFEQVMEGDVGPISLLSAKILADPRHEAIDIRTMKEIAHREHTFWAISGFGSDLTEAV